MKHIIIPILSLLFFSAACNKNDDDGSSGCNDFSAGWQSEEGAFPVEDQRLFITDENGTLIAFVQNEAGQTLNLNTEACGERTDLTQYRLETRTFLISGELKEVPVHHLRTYLGVSDGFEIRDSAVLTPETRAFSIAGVTSVEELLWPAYNTTVFDYPVFIDTQSDLLSFEIPIGAAQPAFLTIRANGEAPTRYLWVDNVDQSNLSFQYENLPLLQPQGPVSLPNSASWHYNIYGLADFGFTRLAAPKAPALVSDEFGAALPAFTDVPQLRLEAFQLATASNGQVYYPYLYDEVQSGLPAAIDIAEPAITAERAEEQLSINISGTPVSLVEVSLTEINAEDERLIWTVYGQPEHFINFEWPDWPEPIAGKRASLLNKNRDTPIIINAKQYNSSTTYEAILEAISRKDQLWEAEQGLRSRGRVVE